MQVRKNQRGQKDAGTVIEARNAKGRNIIKSKRASRNVETLKNIYVDSLVTSTIDRSRNHRKEAHKRDPKREGTGGSLTPPIPGQLAKTDLKITSRSETSVVERTVKSDDRELMSTTSDTKMLNPECQREEMKSAPKERGKGTEKILQETRSSKRGESSTSPKIDGKKKEGEDFVKGQRKKLSFTPISSSVWKRNDLSSMVRTIGSNGRQGEKSQSIPSSRGKSANESCKLQQGHLHVHRGPTKMSDEKESRAPSHDSNKPLRNLTKGSPSRSKTKLWKKYGRKVSITFVRIPSAGYDEGISRMRHT